MSMLIDIHKFWAYDNRESLANTYEEDEDGGRDTEGGGSQEVSPLVNDCNDEEDSSSDRSGKSTPSSCRDTGTADYEDDPYDFY